MYCGFVEKYLKYKLKHEYICLRKLLTFMIDVESIMNKKEAFPLENNH